MSTERRKEVIVKRAIGLLLLVLAVLLGAASDRGPRIDATAKQSTSLVQYLNSVALDLLRQSPQTITSRGLASKLGVRSDALDSLALDATGESYAPLEAALARIAATDLSQEDARSRRCVGTFARWLESAVDGRPYQDDICLVSTYMTSVPQYLAWFMTHIHPLATHADVEDYLSRLSQIPDRFSELVVRLTASEAKGALAPRFLLLRAANEIEDIGRGPSEESEFFTRFAAALDKVADLAPAARRTLLAEATRVLTDAVLPAYRQLATTVREFAARTTDDIGVWRLADGEAYYNYLLRAYTTTDMTADEIFNLGLHEVARLQTEIRSAAADLGYNPALPLPDLFARLRADSGLVSGDDAVRACRTLVDRAANLARPAFRDLPGVPPAVEAGENIAYFVEGAEDGSRPGTFYVPVAQVRPVYSLPSLVYHETIPGHYLQAAVARKNNLPPYLDGVAFSAFAEGWATYAERLAWELGAYENDPYGNIGRLQEELFRAARLVVDPGIHAKRWTYEEAVSYMIQATGLDEAAVRDEVERYIVTPGQAVAYGVGFYKLLELRERAREALGDAFDLTQFHEAVLSCGSVPLPVLEEVVDDYIASRRPST